MSGDANERARAKRAGRLVQLRASELDRVRETLATATRRVAELTALHAAAERRWSEQATHEGSRGHASSAELDEAHAFVATLRVGADRARAEVAKAQADEVAALAAVGAARTALRKLEAWRDGLLAVAADGAMRDERRATDELAARVVRRSGT